MATGILSKNIKLQFKTTLGTSAAAFYDLPNLISIGDVGNDALDTVEITDLASSSHEFIGGLATVPGSIEFTFNFDSGIADVTTSGSEKIGSSFDKLSACVPQDVHDFKLIIPALGSGTAATKEIEFQGYVACKVSGATYNEGLKFVANIVPKGAISL